MKHLFRIIATVTVIVLTASCIKENSTEPVLDGLRRYTLSFEESTKTELSGTGSTRQVNWTQGDAILYYTESGQSSAVSTAVAIDGNKAYVDIPRGRTDEFINAVYGANQLKSGTSTDNTMFVNSPVKNNQSYTSFSQAHLCAAFSDDIEDPQLKFHNASAILKFTSTSAIHKVVLYGNNNETITGGSNGNLKISYSDGTITTTAASTGGTSVTIQTNGADADFYIAIIPLTFTNGITVDCYDESLELIANQKTAVTINTLSNSGTPKLINLGKVQDWMANPHPVAVDLGLSVKWARYNVGATQPEEYGDYFAWGETSPKAEYKWANYSYGTGKNGPFSEYVLDANYGTVDHKTVLDLEDDAAHASWGGDWRMPSREEFEELKENCTWTWTQKNGVNGYRVTSNKSGYTGNSIFLPANGMFSGASLSDAGTIGNYWSSSASDENTYHAISPYFSSSYVKSGNCYRYFGLGVRPVQGEVVPVSSIDVSPTLEIVVGKTATLSASVQPANATYKNVTWASSDESIATVDAAGKVTAVSIGKATVTAYSADAATTGVCEVTVKETATIFNGHEYVDLGLPSGLKWATMNVGASKPEEYGEYFAWGETEPKSNYSWSTYKFRTSGDSYYNVKFKKYCTQSSYWDSTAPMDNKTVLDPEDDAAHVNWGGSWRMPTDAECTELWTKCTWTWTTQNGVNGRKVTGPNGNSIFLPAAGDRNDAYLYNAGTLGLYWSSSLDTDNPRDAWRVYFYSDNVRRNDYNRCYGQSVRPVFTAGKKAEWLFTADALKDYADTFGGWAGVKDKNPGDGGLYVLSNVSAGGKITYVQIDKTNLDVDGKASRIVGATGHPYVTGPWIGDYWLFTFNNGKEQAAGTQAHIKYITRVSKTGPKYWMAEYFDGSAWKSAMEVKEDGDTKYNIQMANDGSTNVEVDCTFSLAKSVKDVQFRMRCVTIEQASGNGPLEKPNGSVSRIAGAEGTSPIFEIL